MNILTQLCLTLDVYKSAGVIAGKRKQLEPSEQGSKFIKATMSDSLSVNSLLPDVSILFCFCTVK